MGIETQGAYEDRLRYVHTLAEVVRTHGHLYSYDPFSPNVICAAQSAAEARYYATGHGYDPERCAELARNFARAAVRYIARFANIPATPAGTHEF